MGRLRERVLSKGLLQKENSRIFHEIVNSGVLNALARDDWEEVEAILKKILPKDVDTKGILDDFVKS